jgi:hypothetical protein
MTEPRDLELKREAEEQANREPEVKPEVIEDLDVEADDADVIRAGGTCRLRKAMSRDV